MAIIRSSNSSDELVVDPITKGARVVLYNPDGTAVSQSNPLKIGLTVPVQIAPGDVTIGAVEQGQPANPINAWPVKVYGESGVDLTIGLTGAAKVDGSAFTQPIEGNVIVTSLPNATIAALPNVNVSTLPNVTVSSLPNVNVSILPNVSISSLPNVTITNFPATQNVAVVSSVEVEIKNDTGNAVPVSLTTLPNVNVSNFPATQPISGTVSVSNLPSTQNVNVVSSVEVEVKNDSGNAIPVSLTTLPNVNVSNFPVTPNSPFVAITATRVAGTTAETLISLTPNKAGTVGAPSTSYIVPNGKTFKIDTIVVSLHSGSATITGADYVIRYAPSSTLTITSSVIMSFNLSVNVANATLGDRLVVPIYPPLHIIGDGVAAIGISAINRATTDQNSVCFLGVEE